MHVGLVYRDRNYLAPAAMARLLTDLEALFFLSFVIGDRHFRRDVTTTDVDVDGYGQYIYLHSHGNLKRAPEADKFIPGKVILERLQFSSPPKIEISLHANLNVQNVAKHLFDFIKYLLTLREQRERLQAQTAKVRQEALASELRNTRELADLLHEIGDRRLRSRLERAIVARIDAALDNSDYPALEHVKTDGPN